MGESQAKGFLFTSNRTKCRLCEFPILIMKKSTNTSLAASLFYRLLCVRLLNWCFGVYLAKILFKCESFYHTLHFHTLHTAPNRFDLLLIRCLILLQIDILAVGAIILVQDIRFISRNSLIAQATIATATKIF